MTLVTASAPGKVIVAGEYAVLQGAPTICIAVNHRATVTIERSEGGSHCVSAPGYMPDEVQFRNVAAIADDHPLLAAVWEQYPMATQEPLNIVIDTRSFYSDRQKLGIGSSAAAVVALCGALGAVAGQAGGVGRRAHAVHRALQGGRGSGADVASSVQGGVIDYRMRETATVGLGWPKDLHYALLWSGHPSSTAVQLEKLDSMAAGAAATALVSAAEDVAAAWHKGAAQPILFALRDYTVALRGYDADTQLGIFEAGHGALTEMAAESGLVYKPCGAGGGDFGIAITDDLRTLRKFVATAEEKGFIHSDMAIDPVGLVVERSEQ